MVLMGALILRGRSSRTETMSGNRRKRLERLEEKYADFARQEALANCICRNLPAFNYPQVEHR